MAEVYNTSPFMLGKRGPGALHHHNHHYESQEQFALKKRRLGYGADESAGFGDDGGDNGAGSGCGMSSPPLKRCRPGAAGASSGGGGGASSSGGGGGGSSSGNGASSQQQPQSQSPADQPRFSSRQLDDHVHRLRTEYFEHAGRKDAQLAAAAEENARLTAAFAACQRELEKTGGENRILRRAVGIQNTRCKELEAQIGAAQQAVAAAGEYVKRLEQTNYAMALRIGSMGAGPANDFMQGRPPDVY